MTQIQRYTVRVFVFALTMACSVGIATLAPLAAAAEATKLPVMSPKDLLVRFQGICLQTAAKLDQLEAMGRIMKWDVAPKDVATVGSPSTAKNYHAWVVRDKAGISLLGYNEGIGTKGQPVRVCTVAVEGMNPAEVQKILRTDFQLKSLGDYAEGYSHTEAYTGFFGGTEQLILGTYDTGVPGAYSLSTMVDVAAK